MALVIALWVVLVPRQDVVIRRRLGVQQKESLLTQTTGRVTEGIGAVLARGSRGSSWERALDRAGIALALPQFVLLVGAGALVGLAIGAVLGSFVVGVLLAVFAVVGALMFVSFRSDARKRAFAEQLEDVLMLLASNLRAGHSLQQSLDSMTADIEEPASVEIGRAVTQVRVGRDLTESLDEVADRMDSDDFRWIVQAIAIHRQVGGNLSDVLDIVAGTIRERGQIRRQVQALSAEGKLSAYVLIALPFFVVLVLSFLNPGYLSVFTESLFGYMMISVAFLLLIVGVLWMRVTVRVEF
ncbi:type II secretion system F family protein [Ornithinimicrobium cerasi]|nr:type II secretion system F family protein [Ornithinimicrobium cerasi]